MLWPKHIDTHSHLNHSFFEEDWKGIVERALSSGTWMIIVGSEYSSSVRAVEMAEKFPYGVYAAVGLHPSLIDRSEVMPGNFGLDAFRELAKHPRVVAIGEAGFNLSDFFGIDDLDRERAVHRQYEVLQGFLSLAHEFNLPLILQARDADQELQDALQDFKEANESLPRGVIHHFTGEWNQAEKYLKKDFLPSFTDLIARSHACHGIINKIPFENFIIESECPFLVSGSTAGPRTEPAHLPGTVAHVAGLKEVHPDWASKQVTQNALRVFSKIIRTLP